jgi:putative flippase GtrA
MASRRDVVADAAEWTWGLARRIHLGTRKPANWLQLFRFGLVGASGYVINIAVFAVLAEGLGIHHIAAAIGAFCVAVTNNFMWNRHWTFQASSGHAGFQAARFVAVSIGALGVNLVALELLVSVAEMPEVPSQALAVALAMPANFIGNKLWTFG